MGSQGEQRAANSDPAGGAVGVRGGGVAELWGARESSDQLTVIQRGELWWVPGRAASS